MRISGVTLFLMCVGAAAVEEQWFHHRTVCTGLGDRVGAMLALSAVARAFNVTVSMRWCMDPMSADALGPLHMRYIPAWTGWHYQLPARPPTGLRLHVDQVEAAQGQAIVDWASRVPYMQALQCLPLLGHELYQLPPHPPVSQGAFQSAYYHAADELFPARSDHGEEEEVVFLHIRTRNHNTHTRDERPSSFCTRAVLRMLLAAGQRVVALTDGPKRARRVLGPAYRHLLRNASNASSSSVWEDMERLANARGILQHASEGWSAYSGVPALARRVPLLNTFFAETSEHRHDLFAAYGGLPPHFYRCRDARLFVAAVLEARAPASAARDAAACVGGV